MSKANELKAHLQFRRTQIHAPKYLNTSPLISCSSACKTNISKFRPVVSATLCSPCLPYLHCGSITQPFKPEASDSSSTPPPQPAPFPTKLPASPSQELHSCSASSLPQAQRAGCRVLGAGYRLRRQGTWAGRQHFSECPRNV